MLYSDLIDKAFRAASSCDNINQTRSAENYINLIKKKIRNDKQLKPSQQQVYLERLYKINLPGIMDSIRRRNEPDEYHYVVKNKNEHGYRLFVDKPHIHTSYSWELFGAEDNYEEKGASITKEQAMVLLNLDDEKYLPSWETAGMVVFPVWNNSDYNMDLKDYFSNPQSEKVNES